VISGARVASRLPSVGVSLLGGLACVAAALALALGAAPASAGECVNEQRRQESDENPVAHRPYSTSLPDCRAYEMVSPPYKDSRDVSPVAYRGPFALGIPVASDGNAAGFASEGAFSGAEAYIASEQVTEDYVSRRGPSGWITSSAYAPARLIGVPSQTVGLGSDFSPDLRSVQLSCGVVGEPPAATATGFACATRRQVGESLSTPVYSEWLSTPVFATVNNIGAGNATAIYLGASSDLTRAFIHPQKPLLPDDTIKEGGIYEIAGVGTASPEPKLRLVNVDESGKELVLKEEGAERPPLLGHHEIAENPLVEGTEYHAISASGETVFFTATPEGTEIQTLYARVDGGSPAAKTVTISAQAPEPDCNAECKKSKPLGATFQGASSDGSKVFFTTAQQLLNADKNTEPDLYEYDFNKPGGHNLTLISGGLPGLGVVRTSSDGSHVYFVSTGVLKVEKNALGEEANANGEKPLAGQPNLYGYDTVTGETKFVATVGPNSVCDPAKPGCLSEDTHRHAQTTPDGRYLVFSVCGLVTAGGACSATKLAGDTNCSPACAAAVYRYDFETGEVTWVSHAAPGCALAEGCTANEVRDAWIAPLPGTHTGAEADINDWTRAISDNGEYIIFTTNERLQNGDVNSAPDVYEWHDGTVSMISDGHDPQGVVSRLDIPTEAASGMSASGSDIFFFTHAALVGQDTDVLGDLYDARINGGFPAPEIPPSCSGEACQGGASEPKSFPPAPSSSFTAGGNLPPPGPLPRPVTPKPKPKPLTRAQKLAKALKACKKDKPRRKRIACERQARKLYGAKAKARSKAKAKRADTVGSAT
jgi:hypothetical protein